MATTKILIVEDEILIAREIEESLVQLGYYVVGITGHAETALQKVSETQPDLVLMDIVIQGEQDGVEVAGQIYDRFRIPVVYLTAYADHQTFERAKQTHPFGYLLKPFEIKALQIGIEMALFHHQTDIQLKQVFSNWESIQATAQTTAQTEENKTLEQLSILSHELQNPLSIIKCSATLLENSESYQIDEAKQQEYIQQIQNASDTMSQLLKDTLLLKQVDQSLELSPVHLDIVDFCRELVAKVRLSTNEKHVILFSCQDDPIDAEVDTTLLWHLLTNLLLNAVKYSPEGGTIALTLSHQPAQSGQQGEFQIKVSDQGIGIPLADQARLFEPFQRGTNVGKLPGTGLGLAIAKRAVVLHGGQIDVQSEPGQGATFTVNLPQRL
jgi:signal transduction histidine kinase